VNTLDFLPIKNKNGDLSDLHFLAPNLDYCKCRNQHAYELFNYFIVCTNYILRASMCAFLSVSLLVLIEHRYGHLAYKAPMVFMNTCVS